MDSALEAELNKLKLTAAEEEIIDFVGSEDEQVDTQISLCLVGKLHTNNPFNAEALKSTMRNVWRPPRGYCKRSRYESVCLSILLTCR